MSVKSSEQTKEKISDILNDNDFVHFSVTYHGCKGIFIPETENIFPCITVTKCNKDICRVYPHKIMFIAIEDRKSVLYLTDGKIETHCSMEQWKAILDEKTFVQPHYSYIVNLHYVVEVTREFVIIRYGEIEHKVYTSMRKLGTFKRAVEEFDKYKTEVK